jgi:membrane protein YdbS with pleckstrin-like domain
VRSRLRPGEELAAEVRRHWIVLAGPFGVTLFVAGLVVAACFVHRPYVLPVTGIAAAASALWALGRWLDWRADLWAVTTQRVIDESGVLEVRVIDSPLDTIHNITCVQSIWGRMMGFGTLNIQTAATNGSTTIPDVAGPEDLRDSILELQQRYKYGGAAHPGGPGSSGRVAAGAGSAPGGGDAAAADSAATRECPYCAETIKAKAKVCRFCGRTL